MLMVALQLFLVEFQRFLFCSLGGIGHIALVRFLNSKHASDTSSSEDEKTGGARLSSARVVRCWVKSRNERNPYLMLPARNGGNS